jgi:diguanylate cyclase (GGDEF)-like protein/PAS domain S-box-containing protein
MVSPFVLKKEIIKVQKLFLKSDTRSNYEKLFHAIYESSSDALMLLNEDGFLDCNSATLSIFGIDSKEKFISTHPGKLSPTYQPNGQASMELANYYIEKALKEHSAHFEWIHQRYDTQEPFYADVLLTAIQIDDTTIIQATVRDISKQKEFQKKLQKNQKEAIEAFEKLINSTLEGIIIFNENRECIRANKMAYKLFDYTKKEIEGKKALDFIAPESRALVKKMLKNSNQQGYEAQILRKDGSTFPALVRGRDLHFSGENIRVSAVIDLTEIKEKEQRALRLAYFDHLTNLPNRQKIQTEIEEKHPFSCAIFNINSFREINDFFGVDAGDSILVQLAQAMQKLTPNLYHIGGDEFAILFYNPSNKQAVKTEVLDILDNLHSQRFHIHNETITLHMNVGIAFDTQKLLTHADIALHQAKEQKSPFSIYEKNNKIEDRYKKNIAIATEIHEALLDDRIVCYYQPIVPFKKESANKYESLVRMIDKDGKVIPPIEFLPVAKKTKIYSQITLIVIEKACRHFASNKDTFSVNLSIDDINDPYIMQKIIQTLIETKTADRIVFEILETEGIENYESVNNFITQVKALGAKIAIDDFGSGYSNYEHILQLNIDYIKIDGSLVKNIATNHKHHIIVETIVAFAKKIGLKTIAEFVHDEAVYETIKALGIDYSQGYFTGKPQKFDEE